MSVFESVVILDSGKTNVRREEYNTPFESAVILASGKTISFD